MKQIKKCVAITIPIAYNYYIIDRLSNGEYPSICSKVQKKRAGFATIKKILERKRAFHLEMRTMKKCVWILTPLVLGLSLCANEKKTVLQDEDFKIAPNFTLQDLWGNEISFSDYKGNNTPYCS